MQRRYTITGDQNAAATTTILGLCSSTSIRPAVYFVTFGSAATPADQAFNMKLSRFTAAGTVGTTFTPLPHDPADPVSLVTAATTGYNHSAEPTYTAGGDLLSFSINQQNTFKWETLPQYGLKAPATAANGIGLQFVVVSGGTALCQASFFHAE